MITLQTLQEYALLVNDIATQAGNIIKDIYESDVPVQIHIKKDNSPVTIADKSADDCIRENLSIITPHINVLSEEGEIPEYKIRKNWEYYWLVDPLDGTKEFIEQTGEFTVNIALIYRGKPIMGVIQVPMTGELFWWYEGAPNSYYKQSGDKLTQNLVTKKKKSETLRVFVSRRHNKSDNLLAWLQKYNLKYEIISCGSSLKMCLLAKGDGDIYVRLGATSEWDTAAGHAILKGVGGGIFKNTEPFKQELDYNNKDSIRNPEFIAIKTLDLLEMLLRKM